MSNIAELYRATLPIAPNSETGKPGAAEKPNSPAGQAFRKELNQQLRFSKHAEARVRSREIPWDAALEKRIIGGIDAAKAKGSRETLILAGDVAVIANVNDRKIITAMDKTQLKERIFTNIDSAVIV